MTSEHKIPFFKDEFHFLSNFHPAPMMYEAMLFPTSEHAYQAAKTLDPNVRMEVANLPSPSKAKRFGKTVELRKDWNDVKLDVMYDIVRLKFTQNSELKRKLLLTDEYYLEEGNHWKDTFWGVYNGIGQNHLGKILMKVRDELKFFEDNHD